MQPIVRLVQEKNDKKRWKPNASNATLRNREQIYSTERLRCRTTIFSRPCCHGGDFCLQRRLLLLFFEELERSFPGTWEAAELHRIDLLSDEAKGDECRG